MDTDIPLQRGNIVHMAGVLMEDPYTLTVMITLYPLVTSLKAFGFELCSLSILVGST